MAERGPPGGEDARRSDDVDLPVAGVGDVVSWSEVTGEDASAIMCVRARGSYYWVRLVVYVDGLSICQVIVDFGARIDLIVSLCCSFAN